MSLGFDVVIDYKSQNIDEELKKYCPEGISVYFDNVGGEMLDIALANLARGARVVICGAISQYNNHTDVQGSKNYLKIVTVRGQINGIIVFDFTDRFPEAVEEISVWIVEGKIHAKEHIIEGIENFVMALRMLFEGNNFGKLLIKHEKTLTHYLVISL